MPPPVYRIEVEHRPPSDDRAELYHFLLQQFDRIDGAHPADQLLTWEQLNMVLDGDSCFIITCRAGDADPDPAAKGDPSNANSPATMVGATVVTCDIESVEWANKRFFDRRYTGHDSTTKVFFIASLGVARSAPTQVLNGMIDRLTDIVAEADGVAVADFADQKRNYPLARHIAARVAMRYESDWQALGSQTYHAFRPGKRVQSISPSDAHRLITTRPVGPGVLRQQLLD